MIHDVPHVRRCIAHYRDSVSGWFVRDKSKIMSDQIYCQRHRKRQEDVALVLRDLAFLLTGLEERITALEEKVDGQ